LQDWFGLKLGAATMWPIPPLTHGALFSIMGHYLKHNLKHPIKIPAIVNGTAKFFSHHKFLFHHSELMGRCCAMIRGLREFKS
jgi:hypothetical protein